MKHWLKVPHLLGACFALALVAPGLLAANVPKRKVEQFPNTTGIGATLSRGGRIDPAHPFFQSLGANGRTCGTCHEPEAGWTITPALIQAKFEASGGEDPLFRLVDGATSPLADVSTVEARRSAYRPLLSRGLIRVGLPIPPDAEFTLEAVDDPHGYASAGELSLYRRPLPATNLRFNATVMWDGRESPPGATLEASLHTQAQHAHLGHAQAAAPLPEAILAQIVGFESGLFTAQTKNQTAGRLDTGGVHGGPKALFKQPFFVGINDPFDGNPQGTPFSPEASTLFKKWVKLPGTGRQPSRLARKSIARGEQLFNSRTFNIRDVAGLNNVLGQPVIAGTCSTCHNTPNVGSRSIPAFMNIGVDGGILARSPDQSRYTLHNTASGEELVTTDPGRALITGKWSDIGSFKVPGLRGLAARPPYFHNGAAATLADVVDFYDRRYGIGLNPGEVADLVAFLQSL